MHIAPFITDYGNLYLFLLLILLEVDQYYCSFQRTSFLSCFFLFSIPLIPAIIFIVSFLLLAMGLVCSSLVS